MTFPEYRSVCPSVEKQTFKEASFGNVTPPPGGVTFFLGKQSSLGGQSTLGGQSRTRWVPTPSTRGLSDHVSSLLPANALIRELLSLKS